MGEYVGVVRGAWRPARVVMICDGLELALDGWGGGAVAAQRKEPMHKTGTPREG